MHVWIWIVQNGFSKTNDGENSTNNDSHDNSGYIQGSSKALVLEKERLSDWIKQRMALKVVSATLLLVWFSGLNESACQTRKNAFLFHFKSSFRSQENQILEF